MDFYVETLFVEILELNITGRSSAIVSAGKFRLTVSIGDEIIYQHPVLCPPLSLLCENAFYRYIAQFRM